MVPPLEVVHGDGGLAQEDDLPQAGGEEEAEGSAAGCSKTQSRPRPWGMLDSIWRPAQSDSGSHSQAMDRRGQDTDAHMTPPRGTSQRCEVSSPPSQDRSSGLGSWSLENSGRELACMQALPTFTITTIPEGLTGAAFSRGLKCSVSAALDQSLKVINPTGTNSLADMRSSRSGRGSLVAPSCELCGPCAPRLNDLIAVSHEETEDARVPAASQPMPDGAKGDLQGPKLDLGESGAHCPDEVNPTRKHVTSQCEGDADSEASLSRDAVWSSPRVSSLGTSGLPFELDEVVRVPAATHSRQGDVEECRPGGQEITCPGTAPEEVEWNSPSRTTGHSGGRDSPFRKWSSPSRATDPSD